MLTLVETHTGDPVNLLSNHWLHSPPQVSGSMGAQAVADNVDLAGGQALTGNEIEMLIFLQNTYGNCSVLQFLLEKCLHMLDQYANTNISSQSNECVDELSRVCADIDAVLRGLEVVVRGGQGLPDHS